MLQQAEFIGKGEREQAWAQKQGKKWTEETLTNEHIVFSECSNFTEALKAAEEFGLCLLHFSKRGGLASECVQHAKALCHAYNDWCQCLIPLTCFRSLYHQGDCALPVSRAIPCLKHTPRIACRWPWAPCQALADAPTYHHRRPSNGCPYRRTCMPPCADGSLCSDRLTSAEHAAAQDHAHCGERSLSTSS